MTQIIQNTAPVSTPDTLQYAVMVFDCVLATQWLKSNTNNRPIKQTTVDRYKRDMLAGSWQFAGDPIRADKTGRLIDGQHRLTAISQLGPEHKISLMVITGLEPESQMTMDQGDKRTAGQQLSILGVKNSMHVAAAAKFFLVWDSGILFKDNKLQNMITTAQIQEWVLETNEFVIFENETHAQVSQLEAPPSVATAALWAFNLVDSKEAKKFLDLLVTGVGLSVDSPILALDKRLRRIRRESIKTTNRDMLALFIMAWNSWKQNKPMTKFQKPRGGVWTDQTFPKVV